MKQRKSLSPRRVGRGLSLLEIIGTVTVLGILAMIVVPRFAGTSFQAKRNGCFTSRGNIEIQAQLWFRNKGTWPDSDLGNIMADTDYFPDGAVTCPVDNSAYAFDSATQRVLNHAH